MATLDSKFFTEASLALPTISEWKSSGESIVFTNGCFDLLHAGHVEYLHRAKLLGSKLVLGLNSDASVQRLKGPHRPIVNTLGRGIVLSALASIDLVVVFDEDTPLQLIQAIQPDLLCKGGDYHVHSIVGAEEVIAYGGHVAILPLKLGYSTTDIERKILSQNSSHT